MFKDKMNLLKMMSNPAKLQEMMQKAQEELEKQQVKGEAGGGAVVVTMNGKHVVLHTEISDEMMKESKETLQDLLTAAYNDAGQKVSELAKNTMMGGMGGAAEF